MKGLSTAVTVVCALLLVSGCGCSTLKKKDTMATDSWQLLEHSFRQRGEVASDYLAFVREHIRNEPRRVAELATAVANVRKLGKVQTPPVSSEEILSFQKTQDDLTRALAKLMIIEQNYPGLLKDPRHGKLDRTLDETESLINRAKVDYVMATHDFNLAKSSFPLSLANVLFFQYADKNAFRASEKVSLATGTSSPDNDLVLQ